MSDKKKFLIRIIVIIAGLAAFIIAADRLKVTDKAEIVTTLGYSYESARVVEVVEDNLSPDGIRVGYQMLKVQLTSGEYKGEIVNATSAEGNLFGDIDSDIKSSPKNKSPIPTTISPAIFFLGFLLNNTRIAPIPTSRGA